MNEFLIISTSIDVIRLRYSDILNIVAEGNYSRITINGGGLFMATKQLGQIERLIETQLASNSRNFIRIGKSLIVNRSFINYVNIPKQKIIMYDAHHNKYTLSASQEALKLLKELIEKGD